MSLDTRNRPETLQQVAGNKSAIVALDNLFEKEYFPHALLITGPTGCGKTTLGRIVANMLGAHEDDYREIDSAQFNGIDTVREIKGQMRFGPRHPSSDCRVWLIDEAHMLGTGGASEKNKAQNAILKMLEDAPDHVYFILCTTDPQRLLKTVVGRCVEISVGTITDKEMQTLLKKVCRKEGEKILDEVRTMIVDRANGHPRNALKLLEKVIGLDEDTSLDLLEQEEQKEEQAIKLARAMIGGSPWKAISGILNGLKNEDEEKIRRMLFNYCGSVLLKGVENEQAFVVMEEMEDPFYNTGWNGLALACYRATVDIGGNSGGDDVPF